MRELVRYDIVVVFRSDSRRIVCKAMQVLIVVSNSQHIAFFPKVTPVERYVGIRKPVGKVRHPFPIGQVFGIAGNGGLSRTSIWVKLPPTLTQFAKL